MKQRICVLGCGWLGFTLAKSLVKNNYMVNGSTTTSEKISVLKSNNIEGFLVQLSSEGIIGAIENCLADCETLVLNIPPGLRKNPEANYVKQMQQLIPYVESSSIKNVLFVSSTSVYDDHESFPIISETSDTSTTSNTAKQLLAVEKLFQNNINFKTTILRFSGLFDEDKHPAKFLSGRKHLKNPEAPVNLIHKSDCIAIIEKIIERRVWNEVFNASTTPHPKKQTYYTAACKAQNLTLPTYNYSQKSLGKIIDSTKLVQVLGYTFKIKLEH
ncbi:Rossmann-fold NAD(P)-binding domain-containing protein [Psychroserpens ponticola]|uniref:NAD(P)H-binding protein n=1 Tax=Psychroserpens ponticola TaxID=2932268 RepID=A0ABY7RXM3_9FLAO|nr:NAD(P)H-binding protein [Psychroserpens ponticola]WCO01854.1 NAD(P)H-binding protein [Psychroserpens ponticola]